MCSLIKCDAFRLNQVLVNLVNNASKYSTEKTKIKVYVKEKEDTILISVKDNGIGLSKEEINELFKPFPDIQRESIRHGSGLGLSVSKGIIELHEGKIWVESQGYGKGSTFKIELPLI